MARYSKKHRVAAKVESYGDQAALAIGAVFAAVVFSVLAGVTILPSAGSGGIFSIGDTMFSIAGRSITNGAVGASAAIIYAYGTDQALEAVTNVQERWQETEVAALGVGALLPVAHDAFPFVSDLTAGEPVAQVAALALYVGSFGYVLNN